MRSINRLEIQGSGAGRHIGSFGRQGHFAQRLAVQPCDDRFSRAVFQDRTDTRGGIGHADFASRFVTEPDGNDLDASLGGFFRRFQGVRVVVFPVGDQQDGSRDVRLCAEAG